MFCLLFIDDDNSILTVNRIYFERHGFEVLTAQNREQAETLLQGRAVDCVILDILMPGTDGWRLCQIIKNEKNIPVVFLTSLTERDCMYRGFDLGADDYMTKPYDLKELEFRVRARINQSKGTETHNSLLVFPPLTIDKAARRALVCEKSIGLTAYEFDILLLLAQSPEQVYSLEEIYRKVWKLPDLGSAQTVRVHLARMRHKLEDACPSTAFIHLVWGRGFMFQYKKEETI